MTTAPVPSIRPEPLISSAAPRAEAIVRAPWLTLYRIGAAGALLSVATIVVAIVVFLAWPPPTTVESWFALFRRNGFLGLLDLDLLLVTSYVLLVPLYLALYVALRRVSPSLMTLALTLNLLGASLILAANPGAAMLTLSERYATAATDAQRMAVAGAGQALLANWSGSGFVLGYLLGGIATLLIAAVMLRGGVFGSGVAGLGLVMGALMLVPASAGTVGLLVSLASLVPTVLWLILVARRLMRLTGADDAVSIASPVPYWRGGEAS